MEEAEIHLKETGIELEEHVINIVEAEITLEEA